jgi:hypothetical protein
MSTTWSEDELRRLAKTDDLHISPFREDGKTYGTPSEAMGVSHKRFRITLAQAQLWPLTCISATSSAR